MKKQQQYLLALFTALAVIIGLTLFSASKPPAPIAFVTGGQSEQPQATKNDQTSHADERGTEKKPLSVKIIPAQKSQAETDADAEERDKKATYDWLTGWGTFATALLTGALAFIALGQVALFVWQLGLIRKGMVDTKEAAKAAMAAARTADESRSFPL